MVLGRMSVGYPKGPRTHKVYTWALKYLNSDYMKPKVYTI